jgi:membrane-associated phospholipid phosphatase
MPSVHAADALVLAVLIVPLVRSAVLRSLVVAWPVWVWFCVLATGNHYWLDVAAGGALALLGLAVAGLVARRWSPMSPGAQGSTAIWGPTPT